MGQIIGNLGQAKNYKAQASVALAQGRAKKTAANKQAYNLEEEARSDSILAGKNMMRQRENQTAAQATVRNAAATSGFTSQGSGQQAEIATADIFETAIRDMALSNAISDSNKRYAADVSRFQGDLAMQQAEAAATQYRRLGKSAQNSAWIQGGLTLASSIVGGFAGAGEGQIFNGTSALSAGNNAYDLSGSMLQWSPGTVNASKDTLSGASASLDALFKKLFPDK